jgi:aminoglycoside phosphotransferase (APT) family kinase protein
MQVAEARRAVAAAMSLGAELDLAADDAVVLNDSNRLVVRLLPCDVVARIAPLTHFASAAREVEIVGRLAGSGSPVARLEPRVEPRVHVRDGFEISIWTYVEPVRRALLPVEYAQGLRRLHAGLRPIDVSVPHFLDRVAATQDDVADRAVTPDLAETDRALLADTLADLGRSIADRRVAEQVLHGEPHEGNVLVTSEGPLFIDFENTCRGPVEYDLAWVPGEVSERYPDADRDVLDDCRGVVLAIIAMHRWSRDDQHPSGRASGVAFLDVLRTGPPWPAIDAVHW